MRKIAVEHDTTLAGLVRTYLKTLAIEDPRITAGDAGNAKPWSSAFAEFRFKVGERTWKRADL